MWVDDYQIDGFRFDGVTSMLYHHHGTFVGFTGHYDEYFQGGTVDGDALVYLQLANEMLHTLWFNSSAEDEKSTHQPASHDHKQDIRAPSTCSEPSTFKLPLAHASDTNCRHDSGTTKISVIDGDRTLKPNFEENCSSSADKHDSDTRLDVKNFTTRKLSNRRILSIAEDVSGMPLLCRPTDLEGGVGFDMRLGMGLPDLWIRLMRVPDEQWDIGTILRTLCDRRPGEATIAYAESHDQALVGDKTLAHWLIDGDIYTEMSLDRPPNLRVDRGMALHKLIRLMSLFLGGEHYLCFEGNEFGHPEWLDFPREGNNWSFHHARRQFSLCDDSNLRYSQLAAFDREMLRTRSLVTTNTTNTTTATATASATATSMHTYRPNIKYVHEDDKIFVAECGDDLCLLVNLHPTNSRPELTFHVHQDGGIYQVALDTDAAAFGGHSRVDFRMSYRSVPEAGTRNHTLCIYLPSRTGIVLRRTRISN